MRKRIITTIALVMCVLAIVVSISAAIYLAHRQSMDEASAQAVTLVGEIIRRTDSVGEQELAAYQRLRHVTPTDTCSEAKRAHLRAIIMDYSYLRAIGFVVDDTIVCSAIGPDGDGLDMGPPSYISTTGTRFHTSVDLGSNRRFLVMEKGGFAASIYPEALIDVANVMPGVSIGVFSRSAKLPLSHRGMLKPEWMTALGPARRRVFSDGNYLVATQASHKFELAAYVAIPLASLKSRMYAFLIILLPIGLAFGVAMATAIVVLARHRTSLPSLLKAALKHREFVLHYQPIVELATGHMVGVEALLRWPRNKQLGLRPALFIQAAEDCGLIQRFTKYVLAQVAIDGPPYFSRYPSAYVSVNLSSIDLRSDDVVESLRRLIATPGIAPHNIVVEVTEHSFVDPASANLVIGQIRTLGVRVAIDDFGTGFSSLSHLTNLTADYLKIDKVFIDAIGTGSVTSEVVLHIIDMARSLRMTLISEGVETQAQADFLREHGVTFAQGWLFSKAQPLAEILRVHAPD